MRRTTDGQWECSFCGRMSKVKTNIFDHIEAAHFESPGYPCDICHKSYRTRHSLRTHKYLCINK